MASEMTLGGDDTVRPRGQAVPPVIEAAACTKAFTSPPGYGWWRSARLATSGSHPHEPCRTRRVKRADNRSAPADLGSLAGSLITPTAGRTPRFGDGRG
jgi:hypothetical protein